jgi:predicted transcriptional regulator
MPRTRRARELMQAHVRTLMRAHLITVAPDDELVDVARELAAHDIAVVPVVDGDHQLLGLISTTDLVNLLHDGQVLSGKVARDLMTSEPISIDEFATADEAIGVIRNALLHDLPVVRERRLVGMVTATDLIRHLLESYPDPEVA